MTHVALLAVILCFAATGCLLTGRAGVGGAVSHTGGDGLLGASGGVGLLADDDQIILLEGLQVGTKQVMSLSGVEYDRNLASPEKFAGFRLRGEGGVLFDVDSSQTNVPTGVLLGLVPGVFFSPGFSRRNPHRLTLALELRGAIVDYPDQPLRSLASLTFSVEYSWVPCTILGGGSCPPFHHAVDYPPPP